MKLEDTPENRSMGLNSLSKPALQPDDRSVVWCLVTALLLAACVVILATSLLPFATARAWVDRYSGDGSAEPYTPALHSRLRIAAAAAGGLLIVSVVAWMTSGAAWLSALSRIVREDSPGLVRSLKDGLRATSPILVSVTLIAIALRLIYLRQPMRYDEAQAFLDYASQPFFVTLSKYDFPNNHVLHSLLVSISTSVLGNDEAAIRLPAFVAGVLIAPASALLAWHASGSQLAALLAGITIACSSILIEYSTNARGYTLLCLLSLICWGLAVEMAQSRWRLAGTAMVLIGALGLWTVPVMLYPLVMVWFWLLLASPTAAISSGLRERLVGVIAIALSTLAVATVFYTPVFLVSGYRSLIGNAYVQPLPPGQFVSGLWNTAASWGETLWRGLPWVGVAAIVVGLGLAMGDRTTRRGQLSRRAIFSGLAMLAVIAVQRVLPPARVGLFLVPLVAVASSVGWGITLKNATWSTGVVATMALASAMAISQIMPQPKGDPILRSPETGSVPDCEDVAAFLKSTLQEREPVICICPVTSPLKYYAQQSGLDMRHFDWPGTEHTRGDIAILVTSKEPPQTVEAVLTALSLDRGQSSRFQLVRHFKSAAIWRLSNNVAPPVSPSSEASPTRP